MKRNILFIMGIILSFSDVNARNTAKPIYLPQAVFSGSSSAINQKLYEVKTQGWTLVPTTDELKPKIGAEGLRFGKKEGVYDVHITPVPEGDSKERGICFLFKVIR